MDASFRGGYSYQPSPKWDYRWSCRRRTGSLWICRIINSRARGAKGHTKTRASFADQLQGLDKKHDLLAEIRLLKENRRHQRVVLRWKLRLDHVPTSIHAFDIFKWDREYLWISLSLAPGPRNLRDCFKKACSNILSGKYRTSAPLHHVILNLWFFHRSFD